MMQKLKINASVFGIADKIGGVSINEMTWDLFKGSPPEHTWFMSYIYWIYDYQIYNSDDKNYPMIRASCRVAPKSWTRYPEDYRLMQHQYGHYLIACLCMIKFQQNVNYQLQRPTDTPFADWCKKILSETSKEFQKMQKLYDQETCHYCDEDEQKKWENKIRNQFKTFHHYFDRKRLQSLKKQPLAKVNPKERPRTLQKPPIGNLKIVDKLSPFINHSLSNKVEKFSPLINRSLSNKIAEKKLSINSQINLYKNIENNQNLPVMNQSRQSSKFKALVTAANK